MTQRIKRQWKQLRAGTPGRRFHDRYRRMHEDGDHPVRRVAVLGLGMAVTAAGIFLLPAPGPGTLVLLLGAGLLAQGSARAARALDWTELRLRKAISWGLAVWKRLPLWGKIAVVLVKLAIGAALLYLAYRVLFN